MATGSTVAPRDFGRLEARVSGLHAAKEANKAQIEALSKRVGGLETAHEATRTTIKHWGLLVVLAVPMLVGLAVWGVQTLHTQQIAVAVQQAVAQANQQGRAGR